MFLISTDSNVERKQLKKKIQGNISNETPIYICMCSFGVGIFLLLEDRGHYDRQVPLNQHQ